VYAVVLSSVGGNDRESTYAEFQSGPLNNKVIITRGMIESSALHWCCCFDDVLEVYSSACPLMARWTTRQSLKSIRCSTGRQESDFSAAVTWSLGGSSHTSLAAGVHHVAEVQVMMLAAQAGEHYNNPVATEPKYESEPSTIRCHNASATLQFSSAVTKWKLAWCRLWQSVCDSTTTL
jgi:hypothetical protein